MRYLCNNNNSTDFQLNSPFYEMCSRAFPSTISTAISVLLKLPVEHRVREISTINQPLLSRSIPWTPVRLSLGCIQWRRLHQCLQREGDWKVGPLKKLEKKRFHKVFMQFGEECNLKYHVLKQIKEFSCLMYGQNRESSMDAFRAKLLLKIVGEGEKLTSKSKVDLARFPPCHSAFEATPPADEPPRSHI